MPTRKSGSQRGRRRGGQELPDNVQDRPEQNAGYDAAVRGESGSPVPTVSDVDVDSSADDPTGRKKSIRIVPDERRRTGGR
jgi:hypothetical protein